MLIILLVVAIRFLLLFRTSLPSEQLSPRAIQALSSFINDPNRLRLALSDRDFTSDDYDVLLQLDEDNTFSRGLPQPQIQRLPEFLYKE
jgi:hypothetical protein